MATNKPTLTERVTKLEDEREQMKEQDRIPFLLSLLAAIIGLLAFFVYYYNAHSSFWLALLFGIAIAGMVIGFGLLMHPWVVTETNHTESEERPTWRQNLEQRKLDKEEEKKAAAEAVTRVKASRSTQSTTSTTQTS